MPHLKLEPCPPLAELIGLLQPFSARDGAGVQKVLHFFMSREGTMILAEALVAEGGLPRHFFLSMTRREELVIRCYPPTDPEKTPAVKRLIARFGLQVAAARPGVRLDPCNLASEIEELSGEASGE